MESLEQIKPVFAFNLSELRRQSGLTQLELADKLQYSDKAISKWERGESIPDISALKHIADTFGVSVDYLIKKEHTVQADESSDTQRVRQINRAIITAISVAAVWLVALTTFVTASMVTDGGLHLWLAFVYAVPLSALIWVIFNSLWFNRRLNFFILSVFLWAVLTALFLTIMPFSDKAWELFLLGIPIQLIIIFGSRMKILNKKSKKSR